MANYASTVINIALAEVGYLEKKSNKNLDSKTANAGSANYTKYGRDMHELYPSVMNFPAAWCDAFVDWCFQRAYGVSNAKSLLGGDFNDYTPSSAQLYKNKKAWGSTPKVGAQIFFKNSERINHTGLVYAVDNRYVYTIEGNTSGASGVIANGGGVCKKKYALTNSKIAGYGYPKYDVEPEVKNETITDEEVIWRYLYNYIGNAYGAAGLMGNLRAESALKSNNVQNSFEKRTGYTDDTYTAVVDNGTYTNFTGDKAGYGLAQWTSAGRKEKLLNYAKKAGKSISDLEMQLGYLCEELSKSYKSVLSVLKKATSVKEASDIVLTKFECPANQSDGVKKARAKYGQEFYDKYASNSVQIEKPSAETKPIISVKVESAQKKDKTLAGNYKVIANALHIRAGAGTTKSSIGILKKDTVVTNYGFYSVATNNAKWLYVKTENGVVGFCSAKYLKKC